MRAWRSVSGSLWVLMPSSASVMVKAVAALCARRQHAEDGLIVAMVQLAGSFRADDLRIHRRLEPGDDHLAPSAVSPKPTMAAVAVAIAEQFRLDCKFADRRRVAPPADRAAGIGRIEPDPRDLRAHAVQRFMHQVAGVEIEHGQAVRLHDLVHHRGLPGIGEQPLGVDMRRIPLERKRDDMAALLRADPPQIRREAEIIDHDPGAGLVTVQAAQQAEQWARRDSARRPDDDGELAVSSAHSSPPPSSGNLQRRKGFGKLSRWTPWRACSRGL